MRLVLNLVLLVLVAVMGFLLVNSITEPIQFKAEKDRRQNAVVDKLLTIRKVQEMYRSITNGSFAPTFDTLSQVLREGRFRSIRVTGDPDDPNFTGVITYDTTYTPSKDTIMALGISLDSLKYVPYGNGTIFDVVADTMTYQSTLVNVVQVSTPIKTFMGKYADARFAKYDNSYNPNGIIKFGDLTKPNISGNWER